jgi:hypothetical protein
MKLQYSNLNNKLNNFFLTQLFLFGVKTRQAYCSSTPFIKLHFSGTTIVFNLMSAQEAPSI